MRFSKIILTLLSFMVATSAFAFQPPQLDPKSPEYLARSFRKGPESGVKWDHCDPFAENDEMVCFSETSCGFFKKLFTGKCESERISCHLFDNYHNMDCTKELHTKINCTKLDSGQESCEQNVRIEE
jgi:hypothetical protein